tara:strand:- start:40 stop:549 length:510 start_codon:yes stop_codon:yes gene_type:complete
MASNTRNLKRFYDVDPAGARATEHACELHDRSLVVGEGHALPPCCGWVVVVHVLVFVPPPHVTLHAATPQLPAQFIGNGADGVGAGAGAGAGVGVGVSAPESSAPESSAPESSLLSCGVFSPDSAKITKLSIELENIIIIITMGSMADEPPPPPPDPKRDIIGLIYTHK